MDRLFLLLLGCLGLRAGLRSPLRLTSCLSVCLSVHNSTGVQSNSGSVQKMVTFKGSAGRRAREEADRDGDETGVLDEQNYVQALGADHAGGEGDGCMFSNTCCVVGRKPCPIELSMFYLFLLLFKLLLNDAKQYPAAICMHSHHFIRYTQL